MPMGENIGQAYVRIHADGSGMDEEVRRSMRDAEPAFEAAGKRHSKAYNDAMLRERENKNFQKAYNRATRDALRQSIANQMAKTDFSKEYFQSGPWKEFQASMKNRYGELGTDIAKSLEDGYNQGEGSKGLKARIKNLDRELANATRRRLAGERHSADEFNRIQQRELRMRQTVERAYSLNAAHDARRAREAATRLRQEEADRRRNGRNLGEWAKGIDRIGERVGKVFGKGSRNNFLNFTGSIVSGMVKLAKAPLVALDSLKQFSEGVAKTFNDAGRGVRGFASALGSIAGSLGGAIFGIGALIGIVGVAVSTLSLAAGVVVALASSIGFALVAAVGAATAVLFPLVAAVAALGIAFVGMSLKQKKALKIKFKPVLDELGKLRQATRDGIFSKMGKAADALAPVVHKLTPLFHNLGAAVGDVVIGLGEATKKNPGFNKFISTMTTFLPNAVRSLGSIFGNTMGAFGGIFRAMIPFMTRTLNYLDDLTGRFSKWTNSIKGQTAIKDFFAKAASSAEDFGIFLGSIVHLLATVFDAGRKTGDSLFESMGNAIDGWNDKLKANPKLLGQWFLKAKYFAVSVGKVILGIAKLFDKLDTAGSRDFATKAFAGAAKVLEGLAWAIDKIGVGKMLAIAGALFGISLALKAMVLVSGGVTAARTLGLIGAAAPGIGAAGSAAAGAAGGFGALSGAMAALGPALVLGLGALVTKFVLTLGTVKASTKDVNDGLNALAHTGKTTKFDGITSSADAFWGKMSKVNKSVEDAVPFLAKMDAPFNNLIGHFRDANAPASALAGVLERAAFTDMPDIFAPESVAAVKSMDTQLSHMSTGDATKAFSVISEEGKKAGLSVEDLTALFPKYAATVNNSGRVVTGAFSTVAGIIDKVAFNATVMGKRLLGLPKSVQTLIETPGMVKTLADVHALVREYGLTPKQVVTTLAASGAAKTIDQVKEARKQFKLTPKQVTTLLTLNGAIKTRADLKDYTKGLHLTPKQVTTIMRVLGIKPARKSVADMLTGLKGLPHTVTTKIVAAGFKVTTASLLKLATQGKGLNGKQIKMIVKATGADISKKALERIIEKAKVVNHTKAVAKAELDHRKFDLGHGLVNSGIKTMTRSTAKPKADLVHGKFDDGKKTVMSGMDVLNRAHATPSVSVNAGNSLAVLGGIKAGLDGIHSKTVQVHIQREGPQGAGVVGATGFLTHGPVHALIGEAGPEALVPLNRPLNMVDPAVRWLSAIAQGKAIPMASGGIAGAGRTTNVGGITVITPNSDARAVAAEVINRLSVGSY